ncbi:hypothetical protein U1Q18_011676, partial [Sarracenia purpurea var. burkii]
IRSLFNRPGVRGDCTGLSRSCRVQCWLVEDSGVPELIWDACKTAVVASRRTGMALSPPHKCVINSIWP